MKQIKGLHHNAYRCRDAEQTRKFYEDFLELPLRNAFAIQETKTGRVENVLHMFFGLADGSNLAFFDVPGSPFEFKDQHDYDLHLALEVPHDELGGWLEKARAAGVETRGPTDHGFMESIYFRDPNGYVIELTGKLENHDEAMDPSKNGARAALEQWRADKAEG